MEVGKVEADAEADAEKVKEATKPTGKGRNTNPADQIRAVPYTKIVTTRGVIVARTQTAQITDPMEAVEAVAVVAVAEVAVAVVVAVEDITMTEGTITKVITSRNHKETDTKTKETNRGTIIQSKRQEELSVKRGQGYLRIQITITTMTGITTTITNATDRNVRVNHSPSVQGESQDRSQMRGQHPLR